MVKINDNYNRLEGSYLFSTIAKKVSAFTEKHPDKKVIFLTYYIPYTLIKLLAAYLNQTGKYDPSHR